MGIHYTYKAQRGERSAKKQAKQMERQRRSRNRQILKQQEENKNNFSVPVNTCITLDMLTEKLLDPDYGVVARVNKNTSTRKIIVKALWVIYAATIGLIIKMFLD